jgi:hypothetical protein
MTNWLTHPIGGIPAWRLVRRLAWVTIEILLVFWLGQKGAYFVYQGF